MRVAADCLRFEVTPAGAPVMARHQFDASGFTATQCVLNVDDEAAVRVEDRAENQSSDHAAPRVGAQLMIVMKAEAKVVAAGQSILTVQGRAVATLEGRASVCCDLNPVRSLEALVGPSGPPRLFVRGKAVVLGRS